MWRWVWIRTATTGSKLIEGGMNIGEGLIDGRDGLTCILRLLERCCIISYILNVYEIPSSPGRGPGLPKVPPDIGLALSDLLGEGDVVLISGPRDSKRSSTSPSSSSVLLGGVSRQPGNPRPVSDDLSSDESRSDIDGVLIRRGIGDKGGESMAPKFRCMIYTNLNVL